MNGVDNLLKAFLEFEKEENLFDQKVFGKFYYWNQVRQYLYECLLGHHGLYSYDPLISGERWNWKKKLGFFGELLRNEFNFLRTKKRKVLFVSTSRNMDERGFAMDSLIADYKGVLHKKEYLEMELFNNLAFDPKTRFQNRYFNHTLLLLQKFSFFIIPKLGTTIDPLLLRFYERFGSNVKVDEKFVKKMVAEFILQYYFFKRAIKKLKPKVVIASQWTTGMYRACNELGIDCVELQHGSFSSNYTLMYDYPDYVSFSAAGSFPKYFFTFGDYWNHITKMPSKKLVMGNSYLSTTSNGLTKGTFKAVLVVSNKDFTPIFLPIMKQCAERFKDLRFYFKLHSPEYEYVDKVKEEFSLLPNVEVIYNEKTTNELLNVSDVMFTIHSTVLYQALQLGVKAIILKRKYYWISEDALGLEDVFLVNDNDELFTTIGQIYGNENLERRPKKEFFKAFDQTRFKEFISQYK
jgi:hypothetical protein